MSSQIVIDGVTYEASGQLASRFGYTIDYISRLAREGRVQATRVGRKWFVEPTSLEQFVEDSKLKKAELSARVSAERKLEKLTSALVSTNAEAVTTKEAVYGESVQRHNKKLNITTALAGSSMVMLAGLLVGVILNPQLIGLQPRTSSSIQVGTGNVPAAVTSSIAENNPINTPTDSRFSNEQAGMGMVVFSGEAADLTEKKVKQSFSDEVKVEFLGQNYGYVTPVFRSGTSTHTFTFVQVPLEESS